MSSISFDIFARDRASATIDKVGDATDKTAGKMSKWSVVGAAAGAAVGAAVISFGKSSVEAYAEAEKSAAQLEEAFRKFPGLADTNITALRGLNTELSKKTKYDDDATASGQAVLASFKLTGKQVQDLTPLLQDYATRTGKDLPTAAQDLGKAMQGQGKALKAIGVDFKDTGDRGGNFDQVMVGLRAQVGGFAEKEGKTAAGQSAILKNQFGEVQESVGAKLTPALVALGGALLSVIGFAQQHTTAMQVTGAAIGGVILVLGIAKAAMMAQAAATGLQTAATGAATVASHVMAGAQAVLNAVMSANPIGLVVLALGLLVGGLVIAYKHSETFRNVVSGAFETVAASGRWLWDNALRPAFASIVGAWLSVVGAIVNGAADAFGWMPGIGPKLRTAADKFDVFRAEVNASLRAVDNSVTVSVRTPGAEAAINALARLRWAQNQIDPVITQRVVTIAERAGFNAGGTSNWRGGLTWVGEQGPELMALPSGTAIYSNSESMAMVSGSGAGTTATAGPGATNVTVNVYGAIGSPDDIARALTPAIRTELAGMARSGVRLGF